MSSCQGCRTRSPNSAPSSSLVRRVPPLPLPAYARLLPRLPSSVRLRSSLIFPPFSLTVESEKYFKNVQEAQEITEGNKGQLALMDYMKLTSLGLDVGYKLGDNVEYLAT